MIRQMATSIWEIYFLRHADAGDPEGWRGDDAQRPLSPKGVRQAERMAAFLGGSGFAPDAILSSPKLRATQTAELVADGLNRPVTTDDRLAGGFTLEGLRSLLEMLERRDGGRRVVLVGHDPDFSSVVSTLCGGKGIRLSTCTLARVDLEERPAAGRGSLRWLIPPEALEGMS
jgi:phosphohistidine phosphatase